jgi:glucan phosphoethanolaminetransferase (alkaline phosphatase superfamily)
MFDAARQNGFWQPDLIILTSLKVIFIFAMVVITNPGLVLRGKTMVRHGEWLGIVQWIAEWVIALLALFAVSFSAHWTIRLGWGMLFAASSSFNWFFYKICRSHFELVDLMTAWRERTLSRNFLSSYGKQTAGAVIVFAVIWALVAIPPSNTWGPAPFITSWFWLPVVSVILVVGEFLLQKGRTLTPMPAHISGIAAVLLAVAVSWRHSIPARGEVPWDIKKTISKNSILLLVDESVRGDYLSLDPQNTLTPGLASIAEKYNFIDFGPAISGGNNSANTNAMLRFGVTPKLLAETVDHNPSLFRYAKRAGFRTVFINAQSPLLRNGSQLMNFMTVQELNDIDVVYTTTDLINSDLELADIIVKELAANMPVFIYGNKNGVHFPYEWNYPNTEPKKRLTEYVRSEADAIAAYRKGIVWAVDKFMPYLFERADFRKTVMIYTSDHGQLFTPGQLTHGQVQNPDPRTALVPLYAYAPEGPTRDALVVGAALSRGRASHFQIAPAIYQLMGYDSVDVDNSYDQSLFSGSDHLPVVLTGDIFGAFRGAATLTTIDPSVDYFEHHSQPKKIDADFFTVSAKTR